MRRCAHRNVLPLLGYCGAPQAACLATSRTSRHLTPRILLLRWVSGGLHRHGPNARRSSLDHLLLSPHQSVIRGCLGPSGGSLDDHLLLSPDARLRLQRLGFRGSPGLSWPQRLSALCDAARALVPPPLEPLCVCVHSQYLSLCVHSRSSQRSHAALLALSSTGAPPLEPDPAPRRQDGIRRRLCAVVVLLLCFQP